MGKSLLILGNGFDLAHGLPTKYSDFLETAKRVMVIYAFLNKKGNRIVEMKYKQMYLDTWNDDRASIRFLKEQLAELFKNQECQKTLVDGSLGQYIVKPSVNERLDAFHDYLNDNIWYDYVQKIYDAAVMRGDNWIDFESEISYIIQGIDDKTQNINGRYFDLRSQIASEDYPDEKISIFCKCYERLRRDYKENSINLSQLRSWLYENLEKLTLALEIYMTEFVGKIPAVEIIEQVKLLNPDYVISFNYTKVYEEQYCSSTPICHIHGICESGRLPSDNNMVLGIDEYIPKEEQSSRVDFAIFKKFVQRIRKRNDVSYIDWFKQLEKAGNNHNTVVDTSNGVGFIGMSGKIVSDVYVFGHSLDVTDKDILRPFFMSEVTRIHIFARDKASEGELITNLLRIMDEEMVIKKSTSGMIEFMEILRN